LRVEWDCSRQIRFGRERVWAQDITEVEGKFRIFSDLEKKLLLGPYCFLRKK
jgi:hypothetical protein